MPFSSPLFIFLFLPVILIGYFISSQRFKNILLLIASLIFYSWGEGKFIFIMLGFVYFNYQTGLLIGTSKHQKKALKILIFSIIINLLFLFYFKYLSFLLTNLAILFRLESILQKTASPVYLPLAISFFVFHTISYNIDIYKKKAHPEKDFINLALYLLFFPHLLAGPIIRYNTIVDQIKTRIYRLDNFAIGITRFIIGLGKKVLIADTLAIVADEVFAIPTNHLTTIEAWLGIICFTLQIYFDFSGYSDMAIGLARMFGFKFPENFNYPYISSSIGEFWRRWHMSLSSWFRDYLYIPLGGNRKGLIRTCYNLMIVFLLVGLWHGAGWNFIAWGAIQGFLLVIERIGTGRLNIARPIKHLYTLLAIIISWTFFRSPTITYGISFSKKLFSVTQQDTSIYHPLNYFLSNDVLVCIIIGVIFSLPFYTLWDQLKTKFQFRLSNYFLITIEIFSVCVRLLFFTSILFLSLITVAIQTYSPFLYFRF